MCAACKPIPDSKSVFLSVGDINPDTCDDDDDDRLNDFLSSDDDDSQQWRPVIQELHDVNSCLCSSFDVKSGFPVFDDDDDSSSSSSSDYHGAATSSSSSSSSSSFNNRHFGKHGACRFATKFSNACKDCASLPNDDERCICILNDDGQQINVATEDRDVCVALAPKVTFSQNIITGSGRDGVIIAGVFNGPLINTRGNDDVVVVVSGGIVRNEIRTLDGSDRIVLQPFSYAGTVDWGSGDDRLNVQRQATLGAVVDFSGGLPAASLPLNPAAPVIRDSGKKIVVISGQLLNNPALTNSIVQNGGQGPFGFVQADGELYISDCVQQAGFGLNFFGGTVFASGNNVAFLLIGNAGDKDVSLRVGSHSTAFNFDFTTTGDLDAIFYSESSFATGGINLFGDDVNVLFNNDITVGAGQALDFEENPDPATLPALTGTLNIVATGELSFTANDNLKTDGLRLSGQIKQVTIGNGGRQLGKQVNSFVVQSISHERAQISIGDNWQAFAPQITAEAFDWFIGSKSRVLGQVTVTDTAAGSGDLSSIIVSSGGQSLVGGWALVGNIAFIGVSIYAQNIANVQGETPETTLFESYLLCNSNVDRYVAGIQQAAPAGSFAPGVVTFTGAPQTAISTGALYLGNGTTARVIDLNGVTEAECFLASPLFTATTDCGNCDDCNANVNILAAGATAL